MKRMKLISSTSVSLFLYYYWHQNCFFTLIFALNLSTVQRLPRIWIQPQVAVQDSVHSTIRYRFMRRGGKKESEFLGRDWLIKPLACSQIIETFGLSYSPRTWAQSWDGSWMKTSTWVDVKSSLRPADSFTVRAARSQSFQQIYCCIAESCRTKNRVEGRKSIWAQSSLTWTHGHSDNSDLHMHGLFGTSFFLKKAKTLFNLSKQLSCKATFGLWQVCFLWESQPIFRTWTTLKLGSDGASEGQSCSASPPNPLISLPQLLLATTPPSETQCVLHSVSQGLVLGHILLGLYETPVGQTIKHFRRRTGG